MFRVHRVSGDYCGLALVVVTAKWLVLSVHGAQPLFFPGRDHPRCRFWRLVDHGAGAESATRQ